MARADALVRGTAQLVLRGARAALAFVQGVVGEDRYEHYLRHHARHHPGEEPLTRKQYWRWVYAEQEKNPQTRCC